MFRHNGLPPDADERSKSMIRLQKTHNTWWQKPLVSSSNKSTTAELAILSLELANGESGVWVNSRGAKSGVVDLVDRGTGNHRAFKTIRKKLPAWLAGKIEQIYRYARIRKGCPDLVIWNPEIQCWRMVEVKRPSCDKVSRDQIKFIDRARLLGIDVKIVEWEFAPGTTHRVVEK